MSAAFREAFGEHRRPLLVVGGPRFDELAAPELGVDRVFGRGTTPGEVASYLVHALVNTGRAAASRRAADVPVSESPAPLTTGQRG
jgi:beta-lysine 5,6-aminomutase beta subunit